MAKRTFSSISPLKREEFGRAFLSMVGQMTASWCCASWKEKIARYARENQRTRDLAWSSKLISGGTHDLMTGEKFPPFHMTWDRPAFDSHPRPCLYAEDKNQTATAYRICLALWIPLAVT